MKADNSLPRILIIDDYFGRTHKDRRNEERANLCGQYLLEDITGDETGKGTPQKIKSPVVQVVFYRGQRPVCSTVGDTVENDLEGTLKIIDEGWANPPYWSLILLDLCFYTGKVTEASDRKDLGMPEGRTGDDDPKQYFGLEILSAIKEDFPSLPVVILSSKPEEEVSLNYTLLGALGFIARADENGPDLLKEHLYRNALVPDESGKIVGSSKALMVALRDIRRGATQGGRRNVLLRGETGTGKSLFAWYAHGQRKNEGKVPYETVNCPQISSDLFASELFGHKKGSFTDAKDDKQGIIEKADNGDVFLDEIGELPLKVQGGILKVIEERTFTRLGETTSKSVDVRFISATNSNLTGFRPDLLMRLTEGGTITLPPLRDRKEDITLLATKFLRDAERDTNAHERRIEQAALLKLTNYEWPGNVRELRNRIYDAVRRFPNLSYFVPDHIDLPLQSSSQSESLLETVSNETVIDNKNGFVPYALPQLLEEQNKRIVQYIIKALEHAKDPRSGKLNYPKTWYVMTNKNIKNSATCQRQIGNYIFQLSDEEIVQLMRQSSLFNKVVEQCGQKIQSVKDTRLLKIKEKVSLHNE